MPNRKPTSEIIIEAGSTAYPANSRWAPWLNVGQWLNLICLLGVLGIAVWSVQEARWIKPAPSLIVILLLAVLAGTVLARSRIPALIAHPLGLLVGLGILFWQGLLLFPDADLLSRTAILVKSLHDWWHAQAIGVPSPVTTHIALMFGYLSWILGYFSVWFLIRKSTPWVAIFLATVVILANLNFWVSDKYYYFLYFLIAALIFIFVATYTRHNSELVKNLKTGRGSAIWIATSLCLASGVLFFTWNNSGFKVETIAAYARAHSPFTSNVQSYWQNFFAPVPGSGPAKAIFNGPQVTEFGGSLELTTQIVFMIESENQNYWKTQIYDYYNSTGWKMSSTGDKTIENSTAADAGSTPAAGNFVYVLAPMVNTNLLPSIGDFASADITTVEKTLMPQTFVIRLRDSSGDSLLPRDIASTAQSIRASRNPRRRIESQIDSLLPDYLKLVSINQSGSSVESITVARKQSEEKTVVALSSAKTLVPQQKVTITVQTPPIISTDKLAAAGNKYPAPVTDRYLQLPSSLPGRVKELAIDITRGASTPYQKVMAIKNYLAGYPYSLYIEAPPPDADGVDYFLFTQKSGYCTYFASAMTVMLRSAGVPARLVSGFLSSEYDPSAHNVIIRERNFHAWTEVYFPGYGWITFDATPNSSSLVPASPQSSPLPLPETPYIDPNASQGINQSIFFHLGDYAGWIIGGVGGMLLLVLLIGWVWINSRPRYISAFYSRMVFLTWLAGLGPKPWQTALEYSRQLSCSLPGYSAEINGIVRVYVESCYGGGLLSSGSGEALNRSWHKLSRALFKRVLRIRTKEETLEPG